MIARTSRGLLLRALRTLLPPDGALPGGQALPPDIAVLVPTLRCNLHCPYCFQRDEAGLAWQPQDGAELSLAEWQGVVAELASLGPHVIVIGGELFLYRDALKLLRAVKQAGLPLTVITNGIALPRVAAELLEIGLDRLIVSLDGPPEIHNAVRGHRRGYQLATEGIARVLAGRRSTRKPFVQVSCALSVYTQAHLAAFVSMVGSLGSRPDRAEWADLCQHRAGRGAARGAGGGLRRRAVPCRRARQWRTAGRGHGSAAPRAGGDPRRPWSERVVVAPPGVEQHLAAYYAPDAPPFRGQHCTAIHRELWVLPNGDIGACGYIAELAMGNVRTGGVLAAWNSPLYRRFRERLGAGLLPTCALLQAQLRAAATRFVESRWLFDDRGERLGHISDLLGREQRRGWQAEASGGDRLGDRERLPQRRRLVDWERVQRVEEGPGFDAAIRQRRDQLVAPHRRIRRQQGAVHPIGVPGPGLLVAQPQRGVARQRRAI